MSLKTLLLFIISFSYSYNIAPTPHFTYKNIVSSSPGGLAGFYTLGVSSYLKQNYNLTDYAFIGASAGSWNSLLLTCKTDNEKIIDDLFSLDIYSKCKTITGLQNNIKDYILTSYNTNDFELDKLYISVSALRLTGFRTRVLYDFSSIEEAVVACYASSFIPFISGYLTLSRLRDIFVDGGFLTFPPKKLRPYFSVSPDMWGRTFDRKLRFKYPSNSNFFKEMYLMGYNDTRDNKHVIDLYFEPLVYNNETSIIINPYN